MRINNKNLFIGIALFLIILDLLVGFNLNLFYIRAVLAFLFIILVPGLLIMLCFKIRNIGFWEYLVYTIGLSVSFIMFAGLAVNWILPWLHITDRPLALWPILLSFNLFLLILANIAYKRNHDLDINIKPLKLDVLNRIFFIIPMFFPVMAILGAFILNNNGPNTLTMIMLGSIAVYVFAVVLFRKRLNENVYPWAIWMIGLSILLMYSMRSWYLMGSDIINEYHFFNLTGTNGLWDSLNPRQAYNTIISITILPTILLKITSLKSLYIFKLLIQIVFSLTLIIIYLIANKRFNNINSFLSAVFFVSQVGFIIDMPTHIRQEIAFLFFGLMLLSLFHNKDNDVTFKLIFLISGFSLIVSHYSTGYLTLFIFVLFYVLERGYKFYSNNHEIAISAIFILILLVFGFFWYSQITPASTGLTTFMKNSISNLKEIFNQDVYAYGQSIYQFKIGKSSLQPEKLINNYVSDLSNRSINNHLTNNSNIISNYNSVSYIPQTAIRSEINTNILRILIRMIEIVKRVPFILLLGGLFYYLIKNRKVEKSKSTIIYAIASLLTFIIVMVLPFGSFLYGTFRVYQQVLFILSPFVVVGLVSLLNRINIIKNRKVELSALFFILYFLIFTGFINQLAGGYPASEWLNNDGQAYDYLYVTKSEVLSISWLASIKPNKIVNSIQDDSKLFGFGNLHSSLNYFFINNYDKRNYFFLGRTANIKNEAFISINGATFGYRIPKYLEEKNKIYQNGGSELLK